MSNQFSNFVGEYLELLESYGVIDDLDNIDPQDAIAATQELLEFFQELDQ